MYSFLRGEMYKAHITVSALARQIGVTEKTLRNKISGETDFTWPEALTVRNIVNPEIGMEELFKKDNEPVALGEAKKC